MLVLLTSVNYPLIDLSIDKEPPPQKPPKNKGPGSFVPSREPSSTRIASTSVLTNRLRQSSDVIPSSLRSSSSLGGLDLYVPPYERNRRPQIDTLVREFNEFGVSGHHYSASFPVSISVSLFCFSG